MKKLLVLMTLLFVLVGCGTKNDKKVVGVIQLVQHDALDKASEGFMDTLKEEFGEDIVIDYQNASGDSATCATIATSMVADDVDLILANATPALQAAAHATNEIPVLGTAITEYGVALGLDDFNGTVGNNISGTSDLAPLDEQAQMIIDLFPKAKVIGLLYCSSEANSLYQVKVVKEFLEAKGLEAKTFSFADSNDVSSISSQACSEVDVLYIPTDNTCASNGEVIKSNAIENNVPIIAGEKECCLAVGGIATLSIDYYELGVTTGKMAIKILNGEDVSKMAIEYYPNPVKMIDTDVAAKFNVEVPSGYEALK